MRMWVAGRNCCGGGYSGRVGFRGPELLWGGYSGRMGFRGAELLWGGWFGEDGVSLIFEAM